MDVSGFVMLAHESPPSAMMATGTLLISIHLEMCEVALGERTDKAEIAV
jgi:hypothetical protein